MSISQVQDCAKRSPKWIVAAEIVETRRVFAAASPGSKALGSRPAPNTYCVSAAVTQSGA